MRNNQTLEQVSNVAESKVQLLKNSKGKYFLSSFMAGMFIGLGILLTFIRLVELAVDCQLTKFLWESVLG